MTTVEGAPRLPTSADVARLAGVSRTTVSHILNGNDERFPEATRERVLSAAEELAYRPSPAARSLASGRGDTVVVLLPYSTFAHNLQDAVDEVVAGTQPLSGNVVVRFASATAQATREALLSLRPLAIVDFGVLSAADRMLLEGAGTVVTGAAGDPAAPGDPDGGIGRLQAQRLLEAGPRTLWYVGLSDQRGDPFSPMRVRALQKFCRERGLQALKVAAVPLELTGAISLVSSMTREEPVGIAAYNDEVALALLAAARELWLSVPSQLSVMGVDNTQLGQLWSPRLTTIDTDFRSYAEALAAELRVRLGALPPESAPPLRTHFTVVDGETA